MAERRSLMDGLTTGAGVDRAVEEKFVFSNKSKADQTAAPQTPSPASGRETKGQAANHAGRTPLTIRFRANFAAALKRASLERQLQGVLPNTLQDILEEAVEPWLRSNGYLN